MAEDADHANDLAGLADAVWDVAGVADELLATSHLQGAEEDFNLAILPTNSRTLRRCAYLALRFHPDHVAAFHYDLIHGLVQHVGASVNCAQSANAFQ